MNVCSCKEYLRRRLSCVFPAFLVAISACSTLRAQSDVFTWVGGSANWDDPGMWAAQSTVRTAPDFPGDTIVSTNSGDVIAVSGTKTVSNIQMPSGNFQIVPEGDARIIFRSGSTSETNTMTTATSGKCNTQIGSGAACSNLVLQITDNLRIIPNVAYNSRFKIHAKITGGSSDSPARLDFTTPNGEHNKVYIYLTNPDNDFYGDITIGEFGNANRLVVSAGLASQNSVDSMFGASTNVITLCGRGAAIFAKTSDSEGLHRTLRGTGTLSGGYLNEGDGWTVETSESSLLLGDGMSVEPSAQNSPFGSIAIKAGTLTLHENARFVFDVGTNANDTVNFTLKNSFVFCGRIVINEMDELDIGDSVRIAAVKITDQTKSFSLEPSFVTPGFNLVVSGSTASGFSIDAVKIRDPSLYPNATSSAPTGVGDTYATLPVEVTSTAPDDSATLRAYISRDSDQGESPDGWEIIAAYPQTVSSNGVYGVYVDGLETGATYYYRHSIQTSAGEFFTSTAYSFTTRPADTPDSFNFMQDSTNYVWSDKSTWSISSYYDRSFPGIAGDIANIYSGSSSINKFFEIDRDITVGSIRIYQGNNSGYMTFDATKQPAVLTFSNGDPSVTNKFSIQNQFPTVNFGTDTNTMLSMHLDGTTEFSAYSAYVHTTILRTPVSGGSDNGAPAIVVQSFGDEYCKQRLVLANPMNSFKGDIRVGNPQSRPSSNVLFAGWDDAGLAFTNSVLGDPSNSLILGNKSKVVLKQPAGETATFSRKVYGSGTLSTERYNSYGQINGYNGMMLDGSVRLEPSSVDGAGYGTITVSAAGLESSENFEISLDVAADGSANDSIVINAQAPLVLNGKLTVKSDDGRIPENITYDIITVNPHSSLSSFSFRMTRTPESVPFVTEVSGDAQSGWTVSARTCPARTFIIVH